jgi:Ser/Thr protein kinase RdoA (MazF antagonist)
MTPRLIAFGDSRTLADRPFSLWERVDGETLGLAHLDANGRANTCREVGRELSRIRHRVAVCPDPNGCLDVPKRELDL